MKINGWTYYNHAAIPSTAPHMPVNTDVLDNGDIWKIDGGGLLFALWPSNWDCGFKTEWWYEICEQPFSLNNLSSSSRRNIRKALRNCTIKQINPDECIEDLWRVFNEATERYDSYKTTISKNQFISNYLKIKNADFWAGYSNESGTMIGYAIYFPNEEHVDFSVAKYSTSFLKLRVSDALNYTTLDYYLNEKKYKYVLDGSRSIVHKTNVQGYLEEHFKYRKAYCRLNIKYRFPFSLLVFILFPFRKIVGSTSVMGNKIHGILKLEEIRRSFL